jgi:predicted transcriptional regulator
MLKNYENITFELTDQEKQILPQIIKGLNTKKGRKNAITGDKICEAMYISPPRLRKIISYIRVNNLIFGLCSANNGYYIAENLKELEECIISLKQRIYTQVKVLNSLEQQTIMFGGTGQLSIFN